MTASPKLPLVPRRAETAVETALKDTRVVLVEGPRQAGKTTLVRQFVHERRPYLSLDDPVILANAKSDPVGFIRNLEGAVIDEIQRAPELMLVIKQSVDTDRRALHRDAGTHVPDRHAATLVQQPHLASHQDTEASLP